MKLLSSKLIAFCLAAITLIVVSAIRPESPAKAQVCNNANGWCVDIICGSEGTPTRSANLVGGYYNCVYLVTLSPNMFAEQADTPWYDQNIFQFGRAVFDTSNPDEIFGERYTYAQVNWIRNSMLLWLCPFCHVQGPIELFELISAVVNMVNGITNFILGNEVEMLSSTQDLNKLGYIGQAYGLMAVIPKYIFTDKISSSVDEIKYIAGKFSVVSPALAQGVGYEKLSLGTIRGFWMATRNMAYLLATIILIVAGFMIIFRTKISAQASVTVQMVIPRLIISLILVTFSYAIVGFILDMIYVIIVAVLGLLNFTQSLTGTTIFSASDGFLRAINTMTGGFDIVLHFLSVYIGIAVLLMIIIAFTPLIVTIILSASPLGPAGPLLAMVISPMIVPILGLILGFFAWSVYVWMRILGQLIVAYISLILLTIAGPIMIIFDILPTSSGGFKKWVLCVIGNASVFVSYALLSIFAFLFFDVPTFLTGFESSGSTRIQSSFDLPLLPGAGGYPQKFLIQFAIFAGFFSMIPNIVAGIKNMFCKSNDPSDFMEKMFKDTVGNITKIGEAAGGGVNKYQEYRTNAERTVNMEQQKAGSQTQPPPTVNR